MNWIENSSIDVAALAIVHEREIVLAKKGEYWKLPGIKKENDRRSLSELDQLMRGVRRKLKLPDIEEPLLFWSYIGGEWEGRSAIMETVYSTVSWKLPKPKTMNGEVAQFSFESTDWLLLTPVTRRVIDELHLKWLIH